MVVLVEDTRVWSVCLRGWLFGKWFRKESECECECVGGHVTSSSKFGMRIYFG